MRIENRMLASLSAPLRLCERFRFKIFSVIPSFRYSVIPSFPFPSLRHSVIPFFRHSVIPSFRHSPFRHSVILLVVVAFAMTTRANQAAQLRQFEQRQRALQAEQRQMQRQAYAPKKIVAEHEHDDDHPHIDAPEIKSAEDAQRWLASPETVERMKEAERKFNENLPMLNAMMASNPVPGKAFAPIEPIKEGDILRSVNKAMASDSDGDIVVKLPQFEALEEWQAAMMEKMTNRPPQRAVQQAPQKGRTR